MAQRISLLKDAVETGDWVDIGDGFYFIRASGNFDGATAQLKFRAFDGDDEDDVDGVVFSGSGGFTNVALGTGQVCIAITGGSSPIISAYAERTKPFA